MKLFHATHKGNLGSIRKNGLLARLTRGKRQAVWLVPSALCDWAVMHVALRHRRPLREIVLLEVEVEAGKVRRHAGSDTFYHSGDVLPKSILSVRRLKMVKEG